MSELLVAIESSSADGSVALLSDRAVIDERALRPGLRHAAGLLPEMRELLRAAGASPRDVAYVAWSAGPGSFTGLRIAATVARMMQSSVGCRVIGVPTMEALALRAAAALPAGAAVATFLDARAGRSFAALYESIAPPEPIAAQLGARVWIRERVAPAMVDARAWIAELPQPCAATGAGSRSIEPLLRGAGMTVVAPDAWPPRARDVASLGLARVLAGDFQSPADILPLYLRVPECEEVYESRRAEAEARAAKR